MFTRLSVFTIFTLLLIFPEVKAADVVFQKGKKQEIVFNNKEDVVVHTALQMFQQDYQKVFDSELKISNKKGKFYISTLGLNSKAESFISQADIDTLKNHEEAFLIRVVNGKLIVLGSDNRGTAYGILEISRLIGVSPWEWWADSPIAKKNTFSLKDGYSNLQYPSVTRRGIFINDEDWGLMPWSSKTYEPSDVAGRIGPKTHARIFELLLRLRANTYWPAMHSCSEAFYLTPGNKEVADKYGIYIGTSHCEPMMRNTNAEWNKYGVGDYNYLTNKDNVLNFWKERVKDLSKSNNIFTLGMRGVHDGRMEGAKSSEQQKEALANIINDQRKMLANTVNPDLNKISQVFIPYKEVLDAYNLGLKVPEDVTLMWTDDNYGYIRHFPTQQEAARKGGNGIYYHISYWGRPHDYLWLSTMNPAQVCNQMKTAYNKGIRDMWVLNVGDIKPAEYLIEMFLDMAWDINGIENSKEGTDKYLNNWLTREFGTEMATELLPVMNEYYRLSYIRKPEFMGNTRTEEKDPSYKIIKDLPWSESYIKTRLNDFEKIEDKVNSLSPKIAADKQYSWFQLIEYPVVCAAEMNKKLLYGQLARHGKADWSLSDMAYDKIVSMTETYNSENNGKWNRIMSYKPRNLAVYGKVPHDTATSDLIAEEKTLYNLNGDQFTDYKGKKPVKTGFGYNDGAISLTKGSSAIYDVNINNNDSITLIVHLAPNLPVDGNKIRYSVSVNDDSTQVVDFATKGRSEEWKQNVTRNQAIRKTSHQIKVKGKQSVKIEAVDDGIVIDQIVIK